MILLLRPLAITESCRADLCAARGSGVAAAGGPAGGGSVAGSAVCLWQRRLSAAAPAGQPAGRARGSEHRHRGAEQPLQLARQGMGALGGDQAQLLDRFAAAADRRGGALVAIGLDPIGIGVEHQGADFAAGSGGAYHGRRRRGTPRPRPAVVVAARTASHREVRSADTAAWPDPCRRRRSGHAGRGHAASMARAAAAVR